MLSRESCSPSGSFVSRLRRLGAYALVGLILSLVAVSRPVAVQAGDQGPGDTTGSGITAQAPMPNDLAVSADNGPVLVIAGLRLRSSFKAEGTLSQKAIDEQRAAIADATKTLLDSLTRYNAAVYVRWESLPYVGLKVDAKALEHLAASPHVTTIQEDVAVPPSLASATDHIGADETWSAGFGGLGQTVVILDTGIDANHPFYGGRVVDEACFSNAGGVGGKVTLCPDGTSSQSGPGSADALTAQCLDGASQLCDHGSHVAGIAGGRDPGGVGATGFNGVAPQTNIIAIQVFSRFNAAADCAPGSAPCVKSFTSDQMSALNYINTTLRFSWDIAAANMSLGGGMNAGACDGDARKVSIDNLRSNGIATVIASGNNSWTDSLSTPGCISTAITVGAVTDPADSVAGFSNMNAVVDLLAPGVSIDSSVPDDTYANFQGTSMATPMVTGAFAVIAAIDPTMSVTDIENLLEATGGPVTDTRPANPVGANTGTTKPRLQLLLAAGQVAAADLSITKSDSPDPVIAGQQLFYEITVTNHGPDNAANVQVVDTLPSGVTYVADTDTCVEAPAGTLTCDLGDIADGDSRSFQIKVVVDEDVVAINGGPLALVNTAVVSSDIGDPNPVNNTVTQGTFVDDSADLRISKYVEPFTTVRAGDIFTYTIFVDNLGPSVARNVVIRDTLLNSGLVSIQSCAFSVTQGGGALTTFSCTTGPIVSTQFGSDVGTFGTDSLDPLTPTSEGRLRASFRLVAKNDIDVTNTVRVTSLTPDPDKSNNFASINLSVTAVSNLKLTAPCVPDPVLAGNTLACHFEVDNLGPSAADNVRLAVSVPRMFEVTNVTGDKPGGVAGDAGCTAGTPGDPSDPATCDFGELLLAEKGTMDVTLRALPDAVWDSVSDSRLVQIDAAASSETIDPDLSDNFGFELVTINAQANLGLTKLARGVPVPNQFIAGQTMVYEYVISNFGPSVSRDVQLFDNVPNQFTFLDAHMVVQGRAGEVPLACSDMQAPLGGGQNTIICQLGDVWPTMPGNPALVYRVFARGLIDPATPGGTVIVNDALLQSHTPEPVPDMISNSASVAVTVESRADVGIEKWSDPDIVYGGEQKKYTIRVTNYGPSDAQSVVVTDVLPPGTVDYEVDTAGQGVCVEAPALTLTCTLPGALPPVPPRTEFPDAGLLPPADVAGIWEFDIWVRVLPNVAPGTKIVNRASVTSVTSLGDPKTSNNTATAENDVLQKADLRVTKFGKPDGNVRAGTVLTYTVIVDNYGPSFADNVWIKDLMQSSGKFDLIDIISDRAATCTRTPPGGAGVAVPATLAPPWPAVPAAPAVNPPTGVANVDQRLQIDCQLTSPLGLLEASNANPNPGRWIVTMRVRSAQTTDINNVVDAVAAPPVPTNLDIPAAFDPDRSNNHAIVEHDITDVSDLVITKTSQGEVQVAGLPGVIFNINSPGAFPAAPNYTTSGPPGPTSQVTAGRRIRYVITVTNNGPSRAENSYMTDRLPAGVVIVPGSLLITQGGAATTGSCETGTPGNQLDRMKCGLGTLGVAPAANSSKTIQFDVIVNTDVPAGAMLENDADAVSLNFDPFNSNNHVNTQSTVLAAADLFVLKTAVGEVVTSYDPVLRQFIVQDLANQVTAGKLLRYQISVQNNGPSDSRNVTIQDTLPGLPLPGPVDFIRSVGAFCRPDDVNQNILFCSLGYMKAGDRVTFDIYVRVNPAVPAGTVLVNCATALSGANSGTPPAPPPNPPTGGPTQTLTWDPNTVDNLSCNNTTVTAVADVFITKQDVPASADLDNPFEPDEAIAGNEHRYLITIGNDGPSVARGVGVTDLLDFKQPGILGETFVRCEAIDPDDLAACSFAGPNTVTLNQLRVGNDTVISAPGNGVLNPGDRYSFYLIVRVDSGYVLDGTDLLAEDTAVITTTTTDFHTQNNRDTEQTLIIAEADLALTKVDDFEGFLECDPVERGGTVTYDIIVENRGPSDAAEVFVVDQMPTAGLILDPAQVTVTFFPPTRGEVVEIRDDGRITVRVGNDPNNSGVAQRGRLNAPGTPGAGTVRIRIEVLVALTAECGSVLQDTAWVETRRNDVIWPPAPEPFPGIDGGPRTPTFDQDLTNNRDTETTTVECPSVEVVKTVSFNGLCPGQNFEDGVINLPAQPVTFCFEITNTGTTFLDDIFLEDVLDSRVIDPTVIFTDTITFGADPLLPVAPGETVRRQVTIQHLLAICACGFNFDTVTVTANPVNSGRTDLPCLSDVTDTDTATIEVPCAGVDWRIQLPVLNQDECEAWIQVQNVGNAATKTLLVIWGEPGFCPPQSSGPLKVECSGLLRPGSSWSFAPALLPAGAMSAVAYSLNATDVVLTLQGNRLPFADVACLSLFNYIVGDHEQWVQFDYAYRNQGVYLSPFDHSGNQLALDFGAHQGEPLAITVNRECPDPTDPNVTINAAYTGVSSDQEGAYDPRSGGFTYYAPLVLADSGGLNSWIWIHNSGIECTSLEIWFRAQDNCLRATLADVLAVAPGESVHVDPNAVVGPNWQGSAWIRSSQPLGVVVDTMGPNHFTSYKGVVGDINSLNFSLGTQVNYAPLIYNQQQGWDTAIVVQNLSSTTNAKVKVYFLDSGGGIMQTLVDWICPRGSQVFFLPTIGGLPGNWVGSARIESQEWWSPGDPMVDPPRIQSVVLLEKWDDPARTVRREAVAYNASTECTALDWQVGHGDGSDGSAVLALPLLAKDYRGITTEIAITNLVPKPGFTDFAIFLYDQNGLLDWVCEKLNEKQVEYIDLASWGFINPRWLGSGVISATFWEHDVFDDKGVFLRNYVGLSAVAVERIGGVRGGPDVPGDESKAYEAFPVFDFFLNEGHINCPGVP